MKRFLSDPMLERGYDGVAAQMQAGRANDLLDTAFAAERAASRTRYVLAASFFTAASMYSEFQ